MADGRKLYEAQVQTLQTNVIDRYDSIRQSLARLQGTIDMIEKKCGVQHIVDDIELICRGSVANISK